MNCLSYLKKSESTCCVAIGLLVQIKKLLSKWISRSAQLTMLWFSSPNSLSAQTIFIFVETKLEVVF